ncbi:hypothetical protein DV737_g887, partial [Chaetothyriales sp. CBS 132003]
MTSSTASATESRYEQPKVDSVMRQVGDTEKQAPEQKIESKKSVYTELGWLDRLLVLWILLAIVIGILLGNFVEGVGPTLQKGKFVDVSVPIAIGLLVMMYPILCKVKYETLHRVFAHRQIWVQLGFSIIANWIIAPLFMLGLAWAFLPDEPGLRNGLIFVGLARCIAMVLIWTGLAGGDEEYCAILVAVNSILQMVLYAPLAILFVNIISNGQASQVSYSIVARSVGVFLGIPLGAAVVTRFVLRAINDKFYDHTFLKYVAPWSLIGLLYTILVLFASQGHQVVHQIVSVVRVAAPLIVYFVTIFSITLWIAKRFGFGYKLAATQSFTAASNNFELAIAVALKTTTVVQSTDLYSPDNYPLSTTKMGMSDKPSVLFVCVHNAGRSQMAACFLNHLAGDVIEVRSAGSAPADSINSIVVEAMREEGIDISDKQPKILTTDAVQASDVVITMGCGDVCPFFPGKRYLDWQLDDPAGQGLDAIRPIRDEIRRRIEKLITELLRSG